MGSEHAMDSAQPQNEYDNTIIIKQGWLQKKSKHFKSWRNRWCVLNAEHLFTFKTQNTSDNPTESIPLCTITAVNLDSTSITLQTEKNIYNLQADSAVSASEWVDVINKYKNHCVKIPVSVICNRDSVFNDTFMIMIPYDNRYPYCISDLVYDIMHYVKAKDNPFYNKLCPIKILEHSFVKKNINCAKSKKWSKKFMTTKYVTDYSEKYIKAMGIYLEIDINMSVLKNEELMNCYELIKKTIDISNDYKQKYFDVMKSVTKQIKDNIQFMAKPLNLNMLHYMFKNGFLSKNEFHIISPVLSANELSKLVIQIRNKQLSEYVFEKANKQILRHYNTNELIELLKKHYSDSFARFVFNYNKFKCGYLKFKLLQRTKYLNIVSNDMLLWIYDDNNTGKYMHIDELKYIFKILKQHFDINYKYQQVVSSITKQIINKNAKFITSNTQNLYFVFNNGLIDIKTLVSALTADGLSKFIHKIKNKTIEKLIFEDENQHMLSHYHDNDLIKLLGQHYSDNFASFVFSKFQPKFLYSSSSKRMKYLTIVSVDMLIWIYQCAQLQYLFNSCELQYLFQQIKKHYSHEYLSILSWITLEIVEKNVNINSNCFIWLKDNFRFIFNKKLVEIDIIIHKLRVDQLFNLMETIHDETMAIKKCIFENQPEKYLSHYNQNELIKLLKTNYSTKFCMFVFNQFSPSFLETDLLQRKMYLNTISIDINMMIWVYYHNNIGKHLSIQELNLYFKKIKKHIISENIKKNTSDNYNKNKYLKIISTVTQQLLEQCPQTIALTTNKYIEPLPKATKDICITNILFQNNMVKMEKNNYYDDTVELLKTIYTDIDKDVIRVIFKKQCNLNIENTMDILSGMSKCDFNRENVNKLVVEDSDKLVVDSFCLK